MVEQEVDREEEFDAFEEESIHFLARNAAGLPVGTARWRFTNQGVKLERFAVLMAFRGQGIAQALIQAVLNNISAHPKAKGKQLYLHAQLDAMPLYARYGFVPKGELFDECNIMHCTMVKQG